MTDYTLYYGKHYESEGKRCAMEWVAHLAGEPHTDRPKCVDPQLSIFLRALNDVLQDDRRQMLRPYLARCIGTAGDGRRLARFRVMAGFGRPQPVGEDTDLVIARAAGVLAGKAGREIRAGLDRLLPTVPVQLPVAEDAEQVCGVA